MVTKSAQVSPCSLAKSMYTAKESFVYDMNGRS